jgi:hypothetical protein
MARATKSKKPVAKVQRHPSGAELTHIAARDGDIVGVGNLRVLITKDAGAWVAQGLEIDYAAYGETILQVKERFESGLAATIEAHLRVHRSLEHLTSDVAPPEVWREFIADEHKLHRFTHSQVSLFEVQRRLPFKGVAIKKFPYKNIDYFEQNEKVS